MTDGPFERFCDELDHLIDRWVEKPLDDRLSRANIIGALHFKAFCIMAETREDMCDDENS